MAQIFLVTGNRLGLFQEAVAARPDNLKIGIAQNSIEFIDAVQVIPRPYRLSITDYFSPYDDVHNGYIKLSVNQTLQLTQAVAKVKEGVAQNFFAIQQFVRTVLYEQLGNTLVISQSVQVGRGAKNNLFFTQQLSFHIVKVERIVDVFNIQQYVNVYKANDPLFTVGEF